MATVEEKTLTSKQAEFLAALLESPTIRAAAARCNISDRQAFRLMKEEPAFRDAFKQSKRAAVDHATSLLAANAGTAVETLIEVCTDKAAPANARVSAAGKVLDVVMRVQEQDEVIERLSELEEALAAIQGGGS